MKSKILGSLFLLAILIISGVTVVLSLPTISPSAKTKPVQLTRLVNLNSNKSLDLITTEVNPDGRTMHLVVKNVTTRNINWFRLALGVGSDVEIDFSFAEKSSLLPGQIYEDDYPMDPNLKEMQVRVLSVVFEDRAIDGDTHYAQLLLEKRKGQNLEVKRFLSLLGDANLKLADSPSFEVLNDLENAAVKSNLERDLSRVVDSSLESEARLLGIRNTKSNLLNDINRIKTLDEAHRKTELIKLETRYREISTTLARYEFD